MNNIETDEEEGEHYACKYCGKLEQAYEHRYYPKLRRKLIIEEYDKITIS